MAQNTGLVRGFKLICERAIVADTKLQPAKDKYPEAWTARVLAGGAEFFLQADDLSKVPTEEAVRVEAVITRVSGGKNFHVFTCGSFTITPIVK